MAEDQTSPPGADRGSDWGLRPGQVFAGHEIEREAGRGGMGIVYAALHTRLRVRRALKVLTERAAGDATFRARFERESQLAAALEHPNIVPVYEAGESDGALFISMRFVDGPNLSQTLASSGPLPTERATALVTQLAAALDAAHGHGLVHRDVKPANILLERNTESERAFLTDFGISRLLVGAKELTDTGEMLGTVDYVAPEQIAGTAVDARADVYSLACVAFEALTGVVPFKRDTHLATMFAHANDPRPRASKARPELPAAIDLVFTRALAIDPERRYARASDFAAELGRALAGQGAAHSARRWPGSSSGRQAAMGAALLVVVGTIGLAIAGVFGGSGGNGNSVHKQAPETHAVSAPQARAVATVRVPRDPVAVAVGAINVWVASAAGHTVSAITPATAQLAQQPIPIDGTPVSAVIAFGSIWTVDRSGGALLRLDPGQGIGPPVRIPVGKHPSDVAVSASRLWVTNEADDTVSRIDPSTNRVDVTVPVGNAPRSISVGEGGVWIAESRDGAVIELDIDSAQRRGDPVRVGGTPSSVAAGEGGIWVVDSGTGRLLRISPGSRTVSPEINAGSSPTSVTTGYGYAWVTFAGGTVRRIDPAQLLPAGEPIPVGKAPNDVAATQGFVWTANSGDSTVTKIRPRPRGTG